MSRQTPVLVVNLYLTDAPNCLIVQDLQPNSGRPTATKSVQSLPAEKFAKVALNFAGQGTGSFFGGGVVGLPEMSQPKNVPVRLEASWFRHGDSPIFAR